MVRWAPGSKSDIYGCLVRKEFLWRRHVISSCVVLLCAEPHKPGPPTNLTEGDTLIMGDKVAVTLHWFPPTHSDLPISRYKAKLSLPTVIVVHSPHNRRHQWHIWSISPLKFKCSLFTAGQWNSFLNMNLWVFSVSIFSEFLTFTLMVQIHQSVWSVCASAWRTAFELNDLWPRYLACWFTSILSRLLPKVKVIGQVRR